jgi:hypothetical protein
MTPRCSWCGCIIMLREQVTVSVAGETLCPNCRKWAKMGRLQKAAIDVVAWAIVVGVLAGAVVVLWVTVNGGGAVP